MRCRLRRKSLVTYILCATIFVCLIPLLILLDYKRNSKTVDHNTLNQKVALANHVRHFVMPGFSDDTEKAFAANITILNQHAIVAKLSVQNFSRKSFRSLYHDPSHPNWLFTNWLKSGKEQCEGKFIGYGGEIALLTDVTLDNMRLVGKLGGEDFRQLVNQREDAEFFKYNNGYIKQECQSIPKYKFNGNNHLKKLMNSYSNIPASSVDETREEIFLGITRYEYVNLYHTMTDFYNAYLVMAFFNLTQSQTNILIMDGHPWGSLDPVWATLFNSVERAGTIAPRTCFKKLILGYMGYESPLFTGLSGSPIKLLPLSEEFREFFLSSYDLPYKRELDCSKLNILFIWRRPYIAHPRNPSGDVHRKIKNEDEVLISLRKTFPNWKIVGAQTDALPMKDQLQLASQADIMIGMHGAALSLTLILPKHGALIELMPQYVNPDWKRHFVVMANWRGLIYKMWFNKNSTLELPNHYTIVPPLTIIEMVSDIYQEMCDGPS